MTDNTLPPMAPGGQWLRTSADQEPHYVVHEAHIKRLLSEGWQPAEDPRKPVAPAKPVEDPEKAEMKRQIAELQAALAQMFAPKNEEADASSVNDEQPDSKNAAHDSRSKRNKPTV